MVHALAPRFLPWCLGVALLALVVPSVSAQDAPGKAAAKKADEDDDKEGVIDATKERRRGAAEVFKDPRAEKALENKFKQFPAPAGRLSEAEKNAVRAMAAMQANPDPAQIGRVVDFMVADLTNQSYIRAVLDPKAFKPNADANRAIERASETLVLYFNTARANKNEAFLSLYSKILFEKLTPLLQSQLFPRVQASIILAMAATPANLDVFTAQLADENQVLWVKLWAARGITNAAGRGRVTIDIVKSTAASHALVDFLAKEPDAPWWIQLRVFEALGSLRLASTGGGTADPNVAAVLLTHASDPKARPEARAWALWALGMLKVPNNGKFNYSLEAYQVGQVAADLGDKIGTEYDLHKADFTKKSDRARFLAALLMYQVYPALAGDDDLPGSGLLRSGHPGAVAARPFMTGLEGQLKDVSRSALDLLNSGGAQQKKSRDDLAKQVAELKSFLDKGRPSESDLFPGAPKIMLGPPKVASVPAPK